MADIFGCFASSALYRGIEEEEVGIAAASGRDLAKNECLVET
jgi:hypothetical protein